MSQVRVEARPCPVCGSTRRSFAVSAPGDWLDKEHPVPDAEYPYYHCLDCEAVYLGNLPSTETLSAYYKAPTYHVRHASLTGDRPDRVAPLWSAYLPPGAVPCRQASLGDISTTAADRETMWRSHGPGVGNR